MGLFGDTVGRVVLKYEADITDAKIKLRELTGEQKKQAQQAVQAVEDQKKAHEQLAKSIALGVGIAGGAIAIGVSSMRSFEERTRLTAASAGADMARLKEASHGLISELDLMKFAAESLHGRWKLTSEEMANVLEAARALELRGIAPLSEAADKLGEAMKKGEVDPLKELGIAYDENVAKLDKRRAAMEAIIKLANESRGTAETTGEMLRRESTEAENYYNRAKSAVGGFVEESVAGFVILNDKMLEWRASIKEFFTRDLTFAEISTMARVTAAWAEVDANAAEIRRRLDQSERDAANAEANRKRGQEQSDALRAHGLKYQAGNHTMTYEEYLAKQREGRTGGGGARRERLPGSFVQSGLDAFYGFASANADEYALMQMVESIASDRAAMGSDLIDSVGGGGGARPGPRRDAAGFALGKGGSGYGLPGKKAPTLVEKLFGSVEEIDAYKTAWGGLQDTLLAGYDAMVSGSESVGKAMKKTLGAAIGGVGQHMFVRGLQETAEAIISWDPRHAASAAAFFAGAAVAGGIAHQLGGDTSTGSYRGGGASSAGVGLGSGGGGQPQIINRTFVIADSFGFEDPRSQARRFANAQRRTRASEHDPEGVQYS